jgi:hypothetical protein
MSAPAKGRVVNPRSTSSARHPYIQISNRPGSAFEALWSDPEYRAILLSTNRKELAAAGYTEKNQHEREYETKHGNSFLNMSKDKVEVRHKTATTSAGWHEEAEHLQRGELPPGCLLDAKHNKYPVCGQDGALDCRGLRAAKQRAHINAVHGVPGADHVETTAIKLIEGFCTPAPSTRERRSPKILENIQLPSTRRSSRHTVKSRKKSRK